MVSIVKKYLVIITALVFSFLMVAYIIYNIVSVLLIGGAFSPRIDHKRMEEIFTEDYELIKIVVDYFVDSEYTSIYIRFDEDFEDFIINDERAAISFNTLKKRGYRSIKKIDNIILFHKSSRGRHFGNGIVYSIDGVEPNYGVNPRDPLYGSVESPTQIMYLTKLEPLPEPNWFYYEEDFREWRLQNKSD